MKIHRRRFLQAGCAFAVLSRWWSRAAGGAELQHDASGNVFLAPDDPAQWPAFRAELAKWRLETRSRLNYNGALYRRKEFAWSAGNYACCFLMLCDERFWDRKAQRYRVADFLDEAEREFGGFDSVVLWHAYPRIGVDQRDQFDFYRDSPGGLRGLRKAVRQFHRRGVRVYIDYNPWDVGTWREGRPDTDVLVELVRDLEVDGIFLDTMSKGAAEFRFKLDGARPGVILESEGAVPLPNLSDHHASWAQWFGDSLAPGVLRHKWLERRHMQHQIRRWDEDHTDELHAAWMNGSGMLVWENVFGSWMPWSPRDRSILRAMLPIQRRFSSLFNGDRWTPLVPCECPGVFASSWEGKGLRLWTLVNRTEKVCAGNLLKVPAQAGEGYLDLIAGCEITPRTEGETAAIAGRILPRGIGCFLAGPTATLGSLRRFLNRQAHLNARSLFHAPRPTIQTRLISMAPQALHRKLPEGMVEIPAATIQLSIDMRVRECGFYESMPAAGHKLADSYNFQVQNFSRRVAFKRFAMDETLVTNAQFAKFIAAGGYHPKHPRNFLNHWISGKPPVGFEDHPVVYVSLDDARAYARWAGKRLPTEAEWQYAAQGADGRAYPWGEKMQPGRCNGGETGGTTEVSRFPSGRSPFGCYDMCGNVWQWTESERSDGRTRFCIIRGGAWFAAKGSNWYLDGGPRPVNFATKFLLFWSGLDRCSTIGFRCAADLVTA